MRMEPKMPTPSPEEVFSNKTNLQIQRELMSSSGGDPVAWVEENARDYRQLIDSMTKNDPAALHRFQEDHDAFMNEIKSGLIKVKFDNLVNTFESLMQDWMSYGNAKKAGEGESSHEDSLKNRERAVITGIIGLLDNNPYLIRDHKNMAQLLFVAEEYIKLSNSKYAEALVYKIGSIASEK